MIATRWNMQIVLIGLLLCFTVSGSGQNIERGITSLEDEIRSGGPFRPGELVFIDVHLHPEHSTTQQIDANGNVTIPHVGQVKLSGLSEAQGAEALTEAFRRIMRRPRVRVSRDVMMTTGLSAGRRTDMQTELIPLQNSDAESIAIALQGMSSDGGSISFYPDTNTVIATDYPSTLQNIMNVVRRIDEQQSQMTQVRIEAKIAEVKVGAVQERGVRWFVQGNDLSTGYFPLGAQDMATTVLRGASGDPSYNEMVGGTNRTGTWSTGRQYVEGQDFDRRLAVPVHVPKPGQMFLGLLRPNIDVGVLLDALVADNQAELLASPNILTVNHQKAFIQSTEKYPITEYGTDYGRGTWSTRFVDLGIMLEVTPHVQRDDRGTYVKLELEPEVSYPAGSSNGVPIRSVRGSRTIAYVRDGQTLVVGGIYRNDNRHIESGVPGLRAIPVVGNLFRHTEKVQSQTELMVFVTPSVHDTPDSITWDTMLNVSQSATEVMNTPPTRTILEQLRRDR